MSQDETTRTNQAPPKTEEATIEVTRLFPTPIWDIALPDFMREKIYAATLPTIVEAQKDSRAQVNRVINSWSSPTDMHKNNSFADINKAALTVAQHALASIGISNKAVKIAKCWTRADAADAHSETLFSSNCYLVAAYCLQGHSDVAKVRFEDPRAGAQVLTPDSTTRSFETAPWVAKHCLPGTLIVFPSWMKYTLQHNSSSEDRAFVFYDLVVEDEF